MDINDIVAEAKFNASFAAQRSMLKTEFKQQTLVAANGGLFQLTPELLLFVDKRSTNKTELVVLDRQELPIRLENVQDLLVQWNAVYDQALNDYYSKLHQLRKARSIAQLVQQTA